MDSFSSELQVNFSQRLEASHVINPSQIWVGAIPKSPNGIENEGVFRSLDSFQFQDEIGVSILKYMSVIPHGILCFVPSYSFLRKIQQRWQSTGILSEMSQIKRVLFGNGDLTQ